MLESSDLVAFAATADPPRARAFYEQVLGLRVVEQNDPDGNTLSLTQFV
jgi:catechol 2,3-dioxygenase-like lactoylglutathione lyase family enzyme